MKPTRHIIIDNETLDTTPSAVLLTIGAVAVEIGASGLTVLGHWYRRIEWWPTFVQPARTTSQATLDWWNTQPLPPFSEAADLNADRLPLGLAMQSLNAWLQLNPYPIWGNGSDFDNAQLQHAFTQHGLRWPYWRNRCLRSLRGTVLDLYPNTQLPGFPANKIKHHALHDAEHEAEVLAVLLQTLAAAPHSNAQLDIAAERRRQIEAEGWTPEHDDKYGQHTLSSAAGSYAMHTLAYPAGDPPPTWPWAASWWKPSEDPRRNWVKAGALIVAEIERFDRAARAEQKAPPCTPTSPS